MDNPRTRLTFDENGNLNIGGPVDPEVLLKKTIDAIKSFLDPLDDCAQTAGGDLVTKNAQSSGLEDQWNNVVLLAFSTYTQTVPVLIEALHRDLAPGAVETLGKLVPRRNLRPLAHVLNQVILASPLRGEEGAEEQRIPKAVVEKLHRLVRRLESHRGRHSPRPPDAGTVVLRLADALAAVLRGVEDLKIAQTGVDKARGRSTASGSGLSGTGGSRHRSKPAGGSDGRADRVSRARDQSVEALAGLIATAKEAVPDVEPLVHAVWNERQIDWDGKVLKALNELASLTRSMRATTNGRRWDRCDQIVAFLSGIESDLRARAVLATAAQRRAPASIDSTGAEPVRKLHGWTKKDLCVAAAICGTTFDAIRAAAKVKGPRRGVHGFQFGVPEVGKLIKAARSGRFTKKGDHAVAVWQGMIDRS